MTTQIVSVNSTTSKVQVGNVDSFSFTAAGINGALGATTPSTGAFTTLSATSSTTPITSNITAAGVAGLFNLQRSGVSKATIALDGSDNFAIYNGAGSIQNLTLTDSGNLGLGVTPSAWGTFKGLQVGNTALMGNTSDSSGRFLNNAYYDGVDYKRIATGSANMMTLGGGGGIQWYLASSAAAGTTITSFGSGSEAMTLDASGNLGLGVTPSAWGSQYSVFELPIGTSVWANTGTANINISTNLYYNASFTPTYKTSTHASQYYQLSGQHIWLTAPSGTAGNAITFTQAMTLDASGNLLVGKTTTGANDNGAMIYPTGTVGLGHVSGTTTGTAYAAFGYDNGGIGSITQNGTTAVAYNTTSDHRLKTNVRDANAARFMDVQFRDFEWVDGRHDCGVVAHELQAVYPDLVRGEKDAEDENGNPVYQQVNYMGLIGRMGAVIQQQQALIEALRTDFNSYKELHP